MTAAERLIAVLRANPKGLDDAGIRKAMGWPPHRQVSPYITWARQYLRKIDSGESIPYRRMTGSDLHVLVKKRTWEGFIAGLQQRQQAHTRVIELASQHEREGRRLETAGKAKEAVGE